jgi:small-conductance mechanosensitive channel
MFDKDMNGDITMEEFEAVCVEIGRERKSTTASLKDLDSVVSKLDNVFVFIILVVTVIVFISLISTSAAGVLTSAGSTILALSWLLSATAQEFLQSIIFVFVKHPFDVGDRVTIYGNTGAQMKGDDFFVKEISLLYTEFKKMEGHVVQAPNSYLNTLFILNQRRSGGLAEAVPIVVKFGTTLDQIDGLRTKLLDFVKSEKREYQPNILTELRDVTEAHSLTLNVVFFYKSNWQNELLRLQRRNKFICALMVAMQELSIEGPRMRYPGQKQSFPVYMQHVPHIAIPGSGHSGHPDNPNGIQEDPHFVEPVSASSYDADPSSRDTTLGHHPSILRRRGPGTRPRGESLAQMSRRLDFSLGMKDISAADMPGDVYKDRSRPRLPPSLVISPERSQAHRSQNLHSPSQDPGLGRSSSVFRRHDLTRVGTDSSMARNRKDHRNRFFGRHPRALEEEELMEAGMVDIPEDGSQPNTMRRLDPRSGVMSPVAWKQMTNDSEMETVSLKSGDGFGDGRRPSTVVTEDLEMRML